MMHAHEFIIPSIRTRVERGRIDRIMNKLKHASFVLYYQTPQYLVIWCKKISLKVIQSFGMG